MIGIDIRFLRIDEWTDIEHIEADCDWPIESFDEFREVFNGKDVISVAGVYDGRVIAYAIMEMDHKHISVARLAVDPHFRRHGVGTQMLNYIVGMSYPGESQVIGIDTCETNLGAHLFLKHHGFRAVAVVRDYLDCGRDAYLFAYGGNGAVPNNRLTLPI